MTGGYSWREFGEDIYLGLSYKVGGFTRAGYLMGGFALGSFIDAATGEWTQSAVDVDLRWFSPLYVWRRSHILFSLPPASACGTTVSPRSSPAGRTF